MHQITGYACRMSLGSFAWGLQLVFAAILSLKIVVILLMVGQFKKPFKVGFYLLLGLVALFLIVTLLKLVPASLYVSVMALLAVCTPALSIWAVIKAHKSKKWFCITIGLLDLIVSCTVVWIMWIDIQPRGCIPIYKHPGQLRHN